ncbi:hypothetical protein G6F59_018664 [Rhizopus arrhizus]|nr:hypothetical protein G6F59_018664 [Rhizopus arrhizus]
MDFKSGLMPCPRKAEMVCMRANDRKRSLRWNSRSMRSFSSPSRPSHLLMATTTARPGSSTTPAMWASCSEISVCASSISSTTLLASMACSVLMTENFSTASNTLPRLRRPAVSISV